MIYPYPPALDLTTRDPVHCLTNPLALRPLHPILSLTLTLMLTLHLVLTLTFILTRTMILTLMLTLALH